MKIRDKVWLVCLITIAGFAAAVFFHYRNGVYHGQPFPRNSFLTDPLHPHTDLTVVLDPTRARNPFGGLLCDYPPFMYVPLFLLTPFKDNVAILIYSVLFIAFTIRFLYQSLSALDLYERLTVTIVLSFLTYPFLFILERSNTDIQVFILMLLFFESYLRGAKLAPAVYLGLATACKIYPFAFVLLFVLKRDYRSAVITAAISVLANVFSLFLFSVSPLESLRLWRSNMEAFNGFTVYVDGGIPFDVSYLAQFKFVAMIFGRDNEHFIKHFLMPYNAFCVLCLALVGWYMWKIERRFWKQVALLTFAIILLPVVSFDYKLVFLIPPVIFFLIDKEPCKNDKIYAVLLGLTLIPKAYLWYHDTPISIEGPLNALIITICALLIMRDGLASQRADAGNTRSVAGTTSRPSIAEQA